MLFVPLWHCSVGCPVSHRVRSPDQACSGRVRPFRSRAPISVFLSCDRPGALCTFGQPVFHLITCGIVPSTAPCCAMWGHPTGHVQVGSFRSRAPVSVLLSCDHPGALWTFGQPVFRFSPLWHRLVRRAVLHHVRLPNRARLGRADSFEGTHINFSKL